MGAEDTSLDRAGRLAQVKEKAADMCEPFRSAVMWMPDDTRITSDKMAYWVPIPWDNHDGRVTLAGDAAHPMTQHRGQGLNHAICDIANLVAVLKKVHNAELTLKEAISEYDTEMVKRGGDEVQAALVNAQMLHDWDSLMRSDLMIKSVERGN